MVPIAEFSLSEVKSEVTQDMLGASFLRSEK